MKTFNHFPAGNPLDEEKMNIQPTGNQPVQRNIQMLLLYSDREKKMHNFRQSVFPLRINNTWYKVTIAKPVGGLHHLSTALIRITLITILVSIPYPACVKQYFVTQALEAFLRINGYYGGILDWENPFPSFPCHLRG